MYRPVWLLSALLLAAIANQEASAESFSDPVISIVIDDMGYRGIDDINALSLPGDVTFAVMPHGPLSVKLSEMAAHNGKTVILHLPMEAVETEKNHLLGPGALRMDMSESQFIATLSDNIRSLPNVIGINNHMGSLVSSEPVRMGWLMDYLHLNHIFYLDSVTSSASVAAEVAGEKQVPFLERDVFLDNERDAGYIEERFDELIAIARKRGSAIAIGHPHPETIAVLSEKLAELGGSGIRLISLDQMMRLRQTRTDNRLSLGHQTAE